MDLTDLESTVRAEIADAVTFIDSEIGTQRALATRYYRGDLFGNEEEGRSQVVSRDVADVVNCILPSLMRIFFGPEKVVEFVPQNEDDTDNADQATDYINYIVTRDNPGFEILYAAFKDALIRKTGIIKWWWDDSEEVSTQEYTGLDDIAITKLMEDLSAAQKAELVDAKPDETGTMSITVKLTKRKDRAMIACLPPEEFLIDRRARTIEDATFVAHRSMKTVSDLVAMGYDRDEVEENSQDGDDLSMNREALARQPYTTIWGAVGSDDPSTKLVYYVEGYIRADMDGDGISELIKVCTMGPGFKVVHQEAVSSRNFAAFQCDPEPHTFFGYSIADKTMDIQLTKSAILRTGLDSLSLAINPRLGVLEGQVDMDDVLNSEIGAIYRMKRPDAVTAIVTPDVSPSAYAALDYMDTVRENRTGMSKVAQGLDPDALQNMTATAASAQFSQSQQHIEIIARIFAETGMKRLFRGLLALVSENQRQQRMVQLRNKWVEIDPRAWRENMDVTANVALGAGTNQEKAGILNMVMQKQELIFQTLGPQNPMVGLPEYHKSLSEFLSLAGFKNPDAYFKDPGTQPPAPAAPPAPDPQMMKVQQDGQIAQAQLQLDQQRLALEAANQQHSQELAEATLQHQMESDEADRATEYALKLSTLNAQFKTNVTVAQIKAEAEGFRAKADLVIQASEHEHNVEMADHAVANAPKESAE